MPTRTEEREKKKKAKKNPDKVSAAKEAWETRRARSAMWRKSCLMSPEVHFGEYLKDLRKNAGLSQVKLAMAVGINHTYVSKVENGIMPPFSPEIIKKMASILGESVENMLNVAGIADGSDGF